MAISDIFITDPVAKRARQLANIEQEQIAVYTEMKRLKRKAFDLKREWERVKLEAKMLRKTGKVK